MKLIHAHLQQLGALLGYDEFRGGVCAGFSGMWMQAVFARDEDSFYARLAFISNYINELPKLVQEIRKTQAKQGKDLNERDIQLLGILGFFDGITLYLMPMRHRDYFLDNRQVNQRDLADIFSLVKSFRLDSNEIDILFDKDYTFSKELLTKFLNELEQLLKETVSVIPIFLSSASHSVCLKYNSDESSWHYVDTNDFQRYINGKNYFRELDTKALADSIFGSFNANLHVIFNTRLLTIDTGNKLKESLQQFNLNYPIGVEQIQHYDTKNRGLLYIACKNGHLETVNELLKLECTVPINTLVQGLGAELFYVVCQNGDTEIFNALLNSRYKVEINMAVHRGTTSLLTACENRHIAIAKELLNPEYKMDINAINYYGATAFWVACYNGDTEIVKAFLQSEDKAFIDKANNNGVTPLLISCQNGYTEIVELLLKPEHKTDITIANLSRGVTPFWMTCYMGHTDIAKIFLKYEHETVINIVNQGVTPLWIACQKGHAAIVTELLASPYLKTLESIGLDRDNTPLLIACSSPSTIGKTELFRALLNHNASLTYKNNTNQSALDIAFSNDNEAAISVILQNAKMKNYALLSIMSVETLEKAKGWEKTHLEPALNDYLHEKTPNQNRKRNSFFDSVPEITTDEKRRKFGLS